MASTRASWVSCSWVCMSTLAGGQGIFHRVFGGSTCAHLAIDILCSSTLQPVLQPRFVPAKKEETPKLGRILFVLRINGQRNFRGWFAVVFFLLLRSGFQYTQVPLLMVDEIAGEALDKC